MVHIQLHFKEFNVILSTPVNIEGHGRGLDVWGK